MFVKINVNQPSNYILMVGIPATCQIRDVQALTHYESRQFFLVESQALATLVGYKPWAIRCRQTTYYPLANIQKTSKNITISNRYINELNGNFI